MYRFLKDERAETTFLSAEAEVAVRHQEVQITPTMTSEREFRLKAETVGWLSKGWLPLHTVSSRHLIKSFLSESSQFRHKPA